MNDLKTSLTSLNLIYFSQLFAVVIFGAVVYYLSQTGGTATDPELALVFRYVLVAVLPLGILIGFVLFKNQIKSIAPNLPLQDKINQYMKAIIVRTALLELPGLLAATAVMLTNDTSLLLFSGIIVVLFFIYRPTTYTISNDLGLTQAERNSLEQSSTR